MEKERNRLANDLEQLKHDKQAATKLAVAQLASELQKAAATKDADIRELKARLKAIEIAKRPANSVSADTLTTTGSNIAVCSTALPTAALHLRMAQAHIRV